MKHLKDYRGTRGNFSGVFGKVDEVALQLINSCKDVFKDEKGEYVKDATSFDSDGNVFFTKRYLTK